MIQTVAVTIQPKSGLVRAIGRWSLVALTVNSVIGSGVFGLPGTVAGLLGKRSILAVLVAGAAIGVIMVCFAEVASQFSEAGGPYLYARSVFGRPVGLVVGWTFYLSQSAAPAANANLFVIYLQEFWPGAKASRVVILSILIGLLALINILGVRQGTGVSNVFTIAKLLPLLMVVLAGAAVTIFRPVAMGVAGPVDGNVWWKAMVLLVFAYGGFETALVPLGEAKNPKRDVGFALMISLLACVAVYVLVQWVVVGVLGNGAATDRPLAEVARHTMGNRGAALVALGALVSVYGYLSAKLLSMPRTTFALAEGGDFFNSDLRGGGVGTVTGRKLCLECYSVGGRAALLLCGGLCCTDRFATEPARSDAVPSARRAGTRRAGHTDVCRDGVAGGLEPVPDPGSDGGRGAAQLGVGAVVATG